MFVTNGTKKSLRLSVMKAKSEEEDYEAFAYVIAPGNGLSIPDDEHFLITEEDSSLIKRK